MPVRLDKIEQQVGNTVKLTQPTINTVRLDSIETTPVKPVRLDNITPIQVAQQVGKTIGTTLPIVGPFIASSSLWAKPAKNLIDLSNRVSEIPAKFIRKSLGLPIDQNFQEIFKNIPTDSVINQSLSNISKTYLQLNNLNKDIQKQIGGMILDTATDPRSWILMGGNKIAKEVPALTETLTKNMIDKYNLPKTVFIEARKIKSIFQTGAEISKAEKELVTALGLDGPAYRNAIKSGLTIEVPAEKITTMVDKPFFAKIKKLFGIKPSVSESKIFRVTSPVITKAEIPYTPQITPEPTLPSVTPTPEVVPPVTPSGGKVIPKDLQFLVEKAKLIPQEEFAKGIKEGLKAQNLTHRDTMKNVVAMMKENNITLDDVYRSLKPTPVVEVKAVPEKGVVLDKIEGKEVLPEEMGKAPSLQKLGITPEPKLVTTREDVLLRRRIRDEARGAKEGAVEARRLTREELIQKFKNSQETIRNIRNDLMQYIDENLPAEAKGKLINPLVMDNLTRKKAASIFSRVDRIKDTITRRQLISEIEKLSVPKGNMAVDYQKKVISIIDGIDLVKPTGMTLRRLKGLRDYIQREGMPSDIQSKYIEKLDRLSQKNVSELTTGDLAELKETFAQSRKLGKLKLELKYKYNARVRKVALDKLLASTRNIDPIVSIEKTKLDTYKIGTKKTYMDTMPTPRVADMIDGYKNYKGENSKYIKNLGHKETTAKNNTRVIVNSALEEIKKLGIEEFTKEQQLNIMINIRYREGAFDQMKTLMEKNGLKDIPKLTEQEDKVIELFKKYTNQNVDDIAVISEEIENKPFIKADEYILPLKYENDFNLIPSQTIEQGRFRTTQTFKGFTYERQKGVTKVPRTDILGIFEEAINEQQWYLNMQPELENIKYLVKSEEYLEKAGEMVFNWWRTELDVVARRGWSATARSNPILRQSRINLNSAILGYKLSSIFMQPFAIFDAMAYTATRFGSIATLEILKEFSKAWIIPKYAKRIISESPTLQIRQGGELAIEEVLKKAGRMGGLWNTFVRSGMSLLQKADIRTAAGVEQGILNILRKHKIPNANEEAEFLMEMVSGSNEVTYRPHILASGEGARTWFTFQTFFLNRWSILIHDIINAGIIRGGGAKGWESVWKRMSALIGLGIYIGGSIAENEARKAIYEKTTGKELPDESIFKQAIMFIPEQIPFFGSFIQAADRNGSTNIPIIRVLENIFKGGASLIKGKKPETKIKGGLRMAEAGATLALGVPGTAQFFDLLEGIFLNKKKSSKIVPREKY